MEQIGGGSLSSLVSTPVPYAITPTRCHFYSYEKLSVGHFSSGLGRRRIGREDARKAGVLLVLGSRSMGITKQTVQDSLRIQGRAGIHRESLSRRRTDGTS